MCTGICLGEKRDRYLLVNNSEDDVMKKKIMMQMMPTSGEGDKFLDAIRFHRFSDAVSTLYAYLHPVDKDSQIMTVRRGHDLTFAVHNKKDEFIDLFYVCYVLRCYTQRTHAYNWQILVILL